MVETLSTAFGNWSMGMSFGAVGEQIHHYMKDKESSLLTASIMDFRP